MTYQQFPHNNACGCKFDLAVIRSKVNLPPAFEQNLVHLESQMLYTKIQPQSFTGFGEEDFLVFLPYMGMAAILFNGMEPFKQIVKTLSTEGPM